MEQAQSEEGVWDIVVNFPLPRRRFGRWEKDEANGVLRVFEDHDEETFPLDTVVDIVRVEEEPPGEAVPFAELFNPERVMEMLKQSALEGDPEWMVPVIFTAPDEDTARRMMRVMSSLVKPRIHQFGDFQGARVNFFALTRFDAWNNYLEFVDDEKK